VIALHRITILPSPLELGIASELALARAIGRALAGCSVAPALPSVLRRAWPGSVGRGIGEQLALLHADAGFVRRARALEAAGVALARALGVDDPTMPDALADPGTLAPEERAADLRAVLLAPALSLALRDRFDEDWYRNPRAAEPLCAASARGGALSIEGWAEELGASADRTPARLAELVR
jgi:hypothetical protein